MSQEKFYSQLNRSREDYRYDLWKHYRTRVTEMIVNQLGGDEDKVLVLGAGNLDDLDVGSLCEKSDELYLTDIDTESVIEGLMKQGMYGHIGLVLML